MSNELKSVLLSIGVPSVGVLGGILMFADSTAQVAGFPVLFAWLFLWMPLTALCIHVAWKCYDEAEYVERELQDAEELA
ncbi:MULTISPECIES: DUF3311 domain-containing protein [unclassified Nocardioides]|uniref:DUF3311 domain-containing protein n=1 Tax=unclassified Nocardioides TaxID=2615069 RepID=UPI000700E478|nr:MULTISPECIES: DUF3311 domain-containing protein [unclassified Nocardioides]KQY55510.1 hypothetical protein ASD30_16560 [Nocardioides sp. Root140]KQZ67173.1 hypothetical protein ASD66_19500 [Nocardioides sp. Root151]KRF12753.1 hypothetical protein ASH02_14565 [Nocardioides sp. Soil796]